MLLLFRKFVGQRNHFLYPQVLKFVEQVEPKCGIFGTFLAECPHPMQALRTAPTSSVSFKHPITAMASIEGANGDP